MYHFINDCNEFADGIFDRYQGEAASTRVPLFQRRPLNNVSLMVPLTSGCASLTSAASDQRATAGTALCRQLRSQLQIQRRLAIVIIRRVAVLRHPSSRSVSTSLVRL